MKREDLQNYRKSRNVGSSLYHSNISCHNKRSYMVFPLCHFMQFILVGVMILGVICAPYFMDSPNIQLLYDQIQQQLSSSLSFASGEWKGSLKNIIVFPK